MTKIKTLPNGELFYVEKPTPDESQVQTSARQVNAPAGQHLCPKCNLACSSPSALQTHMLTDHRPQTSVIEIDGEMVPVDLLSKEVQQARVQTQQAEAAMETMKAELAELRAQMAELSAQPAPEEDEEEEEAPVKSQKRSKRK